MLRYKIIARLGLWGLLFIAIFFSGEVFGEQTVINGSCREITPAVVNPVLRSKHQDYISLDGEWNFAIDPENVGLKQQWHQANKDLPDNTTLTVPGCWEAQGIGGAGKSIQTTPEVIPEMLRGCYVGAAWYKKKVRIPERWENKQVWLKIGGVNAQGWFFVNGQYLGLIHSYCGTYKFNITDCVTAGEDATVAVYVRNDVLSAKGMFNWLHRFGGLYRSVEIEATPDVMIDYVYTEPNFDEKKVVYHVKVRNNSTLNSHTKYEIDIEVKVPGTAAKKAAKTTEKLVFDGQKISALTLEMKLDPFHAWSPQDPFLYEAKITLKRGGTILHRWADRFGIRKWEVRGEDFYLNNKRFLIRGFGDDYMYPLNICSPANKEIHKKHLTLAKSYGFNYVRHHTHCEVPEFYEAASEVGIMVQPELPYYGSGPSGDVGKASDSPLYRPMRDIEELVTHYRRFTSLATYCTGNEGHLGSPIDKAVYEYIKSKDPTRLAIHQDGGRNTPDNSDFNTTNCCPQLYGPNWVEGRMSRPCIMHEYMNIAVEEDPRLSARYVGGILPPHSEEEFSNELAEAGLSHDWGYKCIDGGSYMQKLWQKKGIELARSISNLDGYCYWTILDVGYPSAQGLLNQFWEPKKSMPDYFRKFGGQTVILMKPEQEQLIFAEGDEFKIEWMISNFSMNQIQSALRWWLDADGKKIVSGSIEDFSLKHGDVKTVGSVALKIPSLSKAYKATLHAQLEGTEIVNDWPVWLFPIIEQSSLCKSVAATPKIYETLVERYPDIVNTEGIPADKAEVIIADSLNRPAIDALQEGKKVILLGFTGTEPGYVPGWWSKNTQTGTGIDDKHRAFGDFPVDEYLSQVFDRIIGRTEKLNYDSVYRGTEPIMVNQGSYGYFIHIFQAKTGQGKLLATGLRLLGDEPEAVYLLDQFIRYVKSSEFAPKADFDVEIAATKRAAYQDMIEQMNGWGKISNSPERRIYPSYMGDYPVNFCRGRKNQNDLGWWTKPVSKSLPADGSFKFTWLAGLGFISQPPCTFDIYVGQTKILQFESTHKTKTWTSSDGQSCLKFDVEEIIMNSEDSIGVMELTVPSSMLKAGEPAILRVTSSDSNSRRWFGLYEFP